MNKSPNMTYSYDLSLFIRFGFGHLDVTLCQPVSLGRNVKKGAAVKPRHPITQTSLRIFICPDDFLYREFWLKVS